MYYYYLYDYLDGVEVSPLVLMMVDYEGQQRNTGCSLHIQLPQQAGACSVDPSHPGTVATSLI